MIKPFGLLMKSFVWENSCLLELLKEIRTFKGIHDLLQFIGIGGFLSAVGGVVG